ncbi:MAG: carboxypeptidase-like regulatory domain-containing protein [Taibaiella sp.]|nr:carboxypeptidase-like regulatory domain-containing protein [Taibaiella sp.]
MKKILLSFLFVLVNAVVIWAQEGMLKGTLVSDTAGTPVSEMELELIELKVLKFSDGNGVFSFSNVPYGTYTLQIGDGIRASEVIQVQMNSKVVDLNAITIQLAEGSGSSTEQLLSIGLEDIITDPEEGRVSAHSYAPILSAYRDPFLSAVAYTFGSLRFQLRGYNRNEQEVYINGLPMNDVKSGAAFWGQWGGLNDVFRNQTNSFGLMPIEVGFGGLLGGTAIDATAINQRRQTRITYSNSNRTYRHRVMVTHSTGLMNNGWALTVSASRRWAKEGYIPGTFYDGYAYFLGASKRISSKAFLHFTTFGAPTRRGKAMPAIQEAMDIAGSDYYNPNWGYLNGTKRNARISNVFRPAGILSFEYRPNPLESWNIAMAYQSGYNENSSLDWYNAQDPRPDYYRKLPSFYLYDPSGADTNTAEQVLDELTGNPDKMQIDWVQLYEANRLNTVTVNGITGKRSLYAIGNDVDDIRSISLASGYKGAASDHLKIFGGLVYQLQVMESYRKMTDLLGR